MKKTLLIVLLLSLAVCGFSQRPPRIKNVYVSFGGTQSFRLATVPVNVRDADGTKLDAKRLHFLNFKDAPPVIGGGHLGLNAAFTFPRRRFGFDLMVNFHRFGINMTYPGNPAKTPFVTNSVVPELDLKIELTDKLKHPYAPVPIAYLGAAYNYHFTYSGPFDVDPNHLKAVNNGLEGVMGVGIQWLPSGIMNNMFDQMTNYYNSHSDGQYSREMNDARSQLKKKNLYMSMALLYRLNFYDFFNQDYYYSAMDIHPFEGYTSRFGEIYFRVTAGW